MNLLIDWVYWWNCERVIDDITQLTKLFFDEYKIFNIQTKVIMDIIEKKCL